jgi:putative addiction module component (TIGR02574 family)
MSAETLLQEASKLSARERLWLADALWRSTPDEESEFELSDELKVELDRRLADLEANSGEGSSWEEVKQRLLGRQ